MKPFELMAIVLVLSAILSYLNYRLLKLPATIGLMALTLGFSLILVAVGKFVPSLAAEAKIFVDRFDFSDTVLHGMLGFLLFAGALHVKLDDLVRWRLPIAVLATGGLVISTLIVGGLSYLIFSALGLEVRIMYCLMFGALISPTDPIAVLGLLKQFGAPKPLEVKIAGESLFNDGVAVALFLSLLGAAEHGGHLELNDLVGTFVREAGGGALFGFGIGYVAYRMFKSVDHYQVEVLLSIALVAGGYVAAEHLHVSAPIAMVVAGLLVGNQGRNFAMSETTVERLNQFWELIDEVLNAVLFVLLGLEILVLAFTGKLLLAGVLSVFVVLLARFIAIGLPIQAMKRWRTFEPYTIPIMTWGGLRGGLSVAMALSIPAFVDEVAVPERDVILAATYVVVTFSILVQGLTIGRLVSRWTPADPREGDQTGV